MPKIFWKHFRIMMTTVAWPQCEEPNCKVVGVGRGQQWYRCMATFWWVCHDTLINGAHTTTTFCYLNLYLLLLIYTYITLCTINLKIAYMVPEYSTVLKNLFSGLGFALLSNFVGFSLLFGCWWMSYFRSNVRSNLRRVKMKAYGWFWMMWLWAGAWVTGIVMMSLYWQFGRELMSYLMYQWIGILSGFLGWAIIFGLFYWCSKYVCRRRRRVVNQNLQPLIQQPPLPVAAPNPPNNDQSGSGSETDGFSESSESEPDDDLDNPNQALLGPNRRFEESKW